MYFNFKLGDTSMHASCVNLPLSLSACDLPNFPVTVADTKTLYLKRAPNSTRKR